MVQQKISQLVILTGYNCGFKCAHCGVSGDRRLHLSGKETALLHGTINRYKFRTVSFVGGEPTLYIPEINSVIAGIKDTSSTEIYITSNGSFAGTAAAAAATLSSFSKLDRVQLSYDKYHAEFLPFNNVGHVYRSCRKLGIEFSVVLTIQSPLDLALLSKLRTAGNFPIGVQKVLPFGNAKKNGIDYSHTEFDRSVLRSACPNKGKISYLCGRGFSLCDVLAFSGELPKSRKDRFFPSVRELLEDKFSHDMHSRRFSRLLESAGIPINTLLPKHSSPCTLCETILLSKSPSGRRAIPHGL